MVIAMCLILTRRQFSLLKCDISYSVEISACQWARLVISSHHAGRLTIKSAKINPSTSQWINECLPCLVPFTQVVTKHIKMYALQRRQKPGKLFPNPLEAVSKLNPWKMLNPTAPMCSLNTSNANILLRLEQYIREWLGGSCGSQLLHQ